MGKNKDAAIGFGVIAVIIAVIVGVVFAVLPEEPGTAQNELEESKPVDEPARTEFDPKIVDKAKLALSSATDTFNFVLNECNFVESRADYEIFAVSAAMSTDAMVSFATELDKAVTNLRSIGYDEHPEIGPMIKEVIQLAGATGDCMIDLHEKYGN